MKKKIIFKLPAEAVEGATEALLLGDFNNWSEEKAIGLERQEDGSYRTIVQLEAGKTYQYRFLLNDGRWVNDYNAQNYVPVSGFSIDNCVITVPETLDIEIEMTTKAKSVKKSEKAKTDVEAVTKETKVKKATAPKAKKAKAVTEKTKVKKAEKPAKAVKKDSVHGKK